MSFNLSKEFPLLASELGELLQRSGENELAKTVDGLMVVDRCRCGDDFCATMYTVPRPKGAWGEGHRNVALDPQRGFLILDVLNERIVAIEVLYRDEIRESLLTLLL
ncbi:MAG: hypothetical protein PHX83_15650 [Acidobacteriia bacterium]|nr:hypothetical protein [Terriglobia bacterium]